MGIPWYTDIIIPKTKIKTKENLKGAFINLVTALNL